MGPNPAQPFDLQTQQAKLALAQKLAEALMAQSALGDVPAVIRGPPGNPYARDVANWGELVGRGIQGIGARKQMTDINDQQADLARQLQERRALETTAYTDARFGTPAREGVGPPAPSGEPVPGIPAMKGNYTEALKMAINATDPELRKQGYLDLKDAMSPKDWAQYGAQFTPESRGAFTANQADPSLLRNMPTAVQHDDVIQTIQEGVPVGPPKAMQTFGTAHINPAGIPVQASEVTGREHAQTGGNVTPASKREVGLAEEDIKNLGEGLKVYREGLKGIGNIAQLQTDIQGLDPDKFGTFSGFRNGVSKFVELLGGKKLSDTASMESIHSSVGNAMIAKVKVFAPVSEKEISVMQDIVGSESNTKRALERILDVAAAAIERDQLGPHRKFVESFAREPGVSREVIQRYAPDYKITARPPDLVTKPIPGGTAYKGKKGGWWTTAEEALRN